MQVEKRTADEWFELWAELTVERSVIAERRHAVSVLDNLREYEELNRAYVVADARSLIAYIRFLMAKHNLSDSDIADLGLTF